MLDWKCYPVVRKSEQVSSMGRQEGRDLYGSMKQRAGLFIRRRVSGPRKAHETLNRGSMNKLACTPYFNETRIRFENHPEAMRIATAFFFADRQLCSSPHSGVRICLWPQFGSHGDM